MIEQLLGSKTRYRLMQLFIHHPDVFYYVRQITRILDTQINSVRRELLHLEELGLIQSFSTLPVERGFVTEVQARKTDSSAQKKYFKLNPEFFLYPELKALFVKEQLVGEKDLAKNIRRSGTVNYLILSGFFVGLEDMPADMIIVGKVDAEKLAKIIAEYEKAFNREIKYTVFSSKEYKYRVTINDRFLYTILNNKKIIAINDLEHDDDPPSGGEARLLEHAASRL